MSSYAVLWSEPLHDVEVGKLELEPRSLRFEGAHVHRVEYSDVEGVRIGHRAQERLGGRPAVVVDLVVGGPLRIGTVDGLGTVSELADKLTRLSART